MPFDPNGRDRLVEEVRALRVASCDDASSLDQVSNLLRGWLDDDSWVDLDYFRAATEEDDHVLYAGEDGELLILVVSWAAGNQSAVHDHGTWGVVGVLAGVEHNVVWRRTDDGTVAGRATLELAGEQTCHRGEVIQMDRSVVHRVENRSPDGQTAVSLHVYGHDLTRSGRNAFDLGTGRTWPMKDLK